MRRASIRRRPDSIFRHLALIRHPLLCELSLFSFFFFYLLLLFDLGNGYQDVKFRVGNNHTLSCFFLYLFFLGYLFLLFIIGSIAILFLAALPSLLAIG